MDLVRIHAWQRLRLARPLPARGAAAPAQA